MRPCIKLIVTIVFMVVMVLLTVAVFYADAQDDPSAHRRYDPKYLYKYVIDETPERTRTQADEEYRLCPPLRPERFRRRMKMVADIDVYDYPDNSLIYIADYFVVSRDPQLIINRYTPSAPFPEPDFSVEDYATFRQYVLYNDSCSFQRIQEIKEHWFKKLDDGYFYDSDIRTACDLLNHYYNSITLTADKKIFEYIHKNNSESYRLLPYYNIRISDMQFDLLSLYVEELKQNGEKIVDTWDESGMDECGIWLGITFQDIRPALKTGTNPNEYISGMASYNFDPENGEIHRQMWRGYSAERGICAYLSFLLQQKRAATNKLVIMFMSGQIDRNLGLFDSVYEEIRENVRSNNYYGYTVLRDFCENPMREMPTMEKIGTSFQANVKENRTRLLLEPIAGSYDIDTIQTNEAFKAYEMGHDDYYFVEVVKPVESPVAGPDGYAMILDRTEIVYGYILKEQVKPTASN